MIDLPGVTTPTYTPPAASALHARLEIEVGGGWTLTDPMTTEGDITRCGWARRVERDGYVWTERLVYYATAPSGPVEVWTVRWWAHARMQTGWDTWGQPAFATSPGEALRQARQAAYAQRDASPTWDRLLARQRYEGRAMTPEARAERDTTSTPRRTSSTPQAEQLTLEGT